MTTIPPVPNLGTIVPNLGTALLYLVLAILVAQLLYTIWENREP